LPRVNLKPATLADQKIMDKWLVKRDEFIAVAPAQRTKILAQLSVANIARLYHDN